ncbi:MAG: 30S ribosome-binding factor RbfA [Actinomycetota bacterium]|nr:30S ribosome-binding factor RbfA [Actinomycetota bacterium]
MDRIRKSEIDLKREISFIINAKTKDPRIGFVTVTGTKLSTDYKWLDVFVSIMGSEDDIKKSLEGLECSRGFIKKNLQDRMKLRNIPNIRFQYDKSIRNGIKISKILEKLKKNKQK